MFGLWYLACGFAFFIFICIAIDGVEEDLSGCNFIKHMAYVAYRSLHVNIPVIRQKGAYQVPNRGAESPPDWVSPLFTLKALPINTNNRRQALFVCN
jgi:hypothetical protein